MILRELLQESVIKEDMTEDEIYEFLKNNCMDFLNTAPPFLYRGKETNKIEILSPFSNRKPKDNNQVIQNYFDGLMKKAGCKAIRSNSFFCYSDPANNDYGPVDYGPVHYVFPIGSNWSLSCSPLIDDLFNHFDINWPSNYFKLFVKNNRINTENFIEGDFDSGLINKKTENEIVKSFVHGKKLNIPFEYMTANIEIMLWCEKALFVPVNLIKENELVKL